MYTIPILYLYFRVEASSLLVLLCNSKQNVTDGHLSRTRQCNEFHSCSHADLRLRHKPLLNTPQAVGRSSGNGSEEQHVYYAPNDSGFVESQSQLQFCGFPSYFIIQLHFPNRASVSADHVGDTCAKDHHTTTITRSPLGVGILEAIATAILHSAPQMTIIPYSTARRPAPTGWDPATKSNGCGVFTAGWRDMIVPCTCVAAGTLKHCDM